MERSQLMASLTDNYMFWIDKQSQDGDMYDEIVAISMSNIENVLGMDYNETFAKRLQRPPPGFEQTYNQKTESDSNCGYNCPRESMTSAAGQQCRRRGSLSNSATTGSTTDPQNHYKPAAGQ